MQCVAAASSRGGVGPGGKVVLCRRSSWPPCSPSPDPHCDTQLQPRNFRIQSDCVSEDTENSVLTNNSVDRKRRIASIFQHYYPEGGWGIVLLIVVILVQIILHGLLLSYGVLLAKVVRRFRVSHFQSGVLGCLPLSISLLVSPLTVSYCRKKSIRLTAVLGGLVSSLACLFASFALQYHQLVLSYGIILGVGVGMARDTSTLMVGQYFKKRRELVEIFLVSSSGVGVATMSSFVRLVTREIGWRLGIQAVTGVVFSTFILGMFYRSASLYHPQRRAILHLKSIKRKIKEKNKSQEDTQPFFDVSCLKSVTFRIFLASTGVSSFGLYTPLIYMVVQAQTEGGLESLEVVQLQVWLGLAWMAGSVICGILCLHRSRECSISRQYLCQACLVFAAIGILALNSVSSYSGYTVFVWVYGSSLGGYNYTLKMSIYHVVRARNFGRAWSYVQFCQAVPLVCGVVISGIYYQFGNYFSVVSIVVSSIILSFINIHKRKRGRRRRGLGRHKLHLPEEKCHEKITRRKTTESPVRVPIRSAVSYEDCGPNSPYIYQSQNSLDEILDLKKPELTCVSEEEIADMDLPDNILEELEYLDNITSCNKVENCLMLSEYEQNLIKEKEGPVTLAYRKARKWSLVRQSSSIMQGSLLDTIPESVERRKSGELSRFRSGIDLLSTHKISEKSNFGGKTGVKKLFPLNRSITTIPEDFLSPSLEED